MKKIILILFTLLQFPANAKTCLTPPIGTEKKELFDINPKEKSL